MIIFVLLLKLVLLSSFHHRFLGFLSKLTFPNSITQALFFQANYLFIFLFLIFSFIFHCSFLLAFFYVNLSIFLPTFFSTETFSSVFLITLDNFLSSHSFIHVVQHMLVLLIYKCTSVFYSTCKFVHAFFKLYNLFFSITDIMLLFFVDFLVFFHPSSSLHTRHAAFTDFNQLADKQHDFFRLFRFSV